MIFNSADGFGLGMAEQKEQEQYPVVAEIWSVLQGALQIQAKKLVEDIAKFQGADPKALWAKIRPIVKIGLIDSDVPEGPTLCPYPSNNSEGAIRQRCRAPCLLGFQACPAHISTKMAVSEGNYEIVDRVIDINDITYYIDRSGQALDKNGEIQGRMVDDVLYVYEAQEV